MIFTYKNWDKFCKTLSNKGVISVPAKQVFELNSKYLVLKHDVETNVKKAYKIAKIEYEEWEDAISELEDLIDEVQDEIDSREDK